ncbi:Uncharacterized protein FKW44_025360 [Caligus rogercresseyi]|uniref:Uncharacterized protein n=1 Tax=Caligus rogercresseyi TaxID=217165 RepID=A0A7T8GKF4_CALRO|nr:Uncharacterized protein FKW44_025360 [Caligus rogercresseyi]
MILFAKSVSVGRRVCRRGEEEGQRGRQQVLHQVGRRDGLLQADHCQHHKQGPGLQFVQEEAQAHKSRETQAWLLENLPYHWSPDLWPPSSPDCNPLDYSLREQTNKHAHNTLDSLRAISEEFANMKKDVVAKACFRHRLEMVVAADGGYIEK